MTRRVPDWDALRAACADAIQQVLRDADCRFEATEHSDDGNGPWVRFTVETNLPDDKKFEIVVFSDSAHVSLAGATVRDQIEGYTKRVGFLQSEIDAEAWVAGTVRLVGEIVKLEPLKVRTRVTNKRSGTINGAIACRDGDGKECWMGELRAAGGEGETRVFENWLPRRA